MYKILYIYITHAHAHNVKCLKIKDPSQFNGVAVSDRVSCSLCKQLRNIVAKQSAPIGWSRLKIANVRRPSISRAPNFWRLLIWVWQSQVSIWIISLWYQELFKPSCPLGKTCRMPAFVSPHSGWKETYGPRSAPLRFWQVHTSTRSNISKNRLINKSISTYILSRVFAFCTWNAWWKAYITS